MSSSNDRRRQESRAKLRKLLPNATEDMIRTIAEVSNPIERIGYALFFARERNYDEVGLNRIEVYRRTMVVSIDQKYVDEMVKELSRLANEPPSREVNKKIHIIRVGLNGMTDFDFDGYISLDDSRYKPTYVDPLLKGIARATGNTARAVKSGKGLLNWEIKN